MKEEEREGREKKKKGKRLSLKLFYSTDWLFPPSLLRLQAKLLTYLAQ